jgi:hypothetical protein
MQELIDLKQYLREGKTQEALLLVEELEEMSRADRINNLESYLLILLIHLIKIQVEKRITRSWKSSIINSLLAIKKRNKLGKKAFYIYKDDWEEYIANNYKIAVYEASQEVFEGIEYQELNSLCDRNKITAKAINLLSLTYEKDDELIFANPKIFEN